jgi:uncharacterized protein (DUF362 family)
MQDNRRDFITKLLAGLGACGLGLSGIARAAVPTGESVWCEGKDPYANTVAALNKLGGMKRFVKKGQTVCLVPNIGWARTMGQCGNTHPEVVRALIDMCDKAGAKSTTVFCNPCNDMRVCLDKSGIGKVIDNSPARFEFINSKGWRQRKAVRGCTHLKSTEVYRLIDDCDVVINAPVAKHHGGAQLTMCCKNLMGVIQDRGTLHQKLHTGIADLTMMVPHDLCVLDASRILLRGGPSSGDLNNVEWKDTLIAGTNPLEVDVLGTTLFNMKPTDIGYIKILGERGYGHVDPAKLSVSYIKA